MGQKALADEDKDDQSVHLELRDYVAIVIASLETVLLPFLIVIAVMIVLWLVISR